MTSAASYRYFQKLYSKKCVCFSLINFKPLLIPKQNGLLQNYRSIQNVRSPNSPGGKFSRIALVLGLGAVASTGYELYAIKFAKPNEVLNRKLVYDELDGKKKPKLPDTIKPTRKVEGPFKELDYTVTLYQYQSCPFCGKVRAFLDYYGIPYNVVEVHSVNQKAIEWSDYKKVPILLVEHGKDRFEILHDSSVIVSIMGSKVFQPLKDLGELSLQYKRGEYSDKEGDKKGRKVSEYIQKYFLKVEVKDLPKNKNNDDLKEERKWRQWVDDELVHMISPNVCRTLAESIETFKHFSESGQWDSIFSKSEQYSAIYKAAIVTYFISKRLKSKYQLKKNVRDSLYDTVNNFVDSLPKNKHFMGGDNPNLADLAVFGVLNSMKDCEAFNDMMMNSKIAPWYELMAKAVEKHEGYYKVVDNFKKLSKRKTKV